MSTMTRIDITSAKTSEHLGELLRDITDSFIRGNSEFLGGSDGLEALCVISMHTSSARRFLQVEVAPRQSSEELERSAPADLASLSLLNGNAAGRGAMICMPLDLDQGTLAFSGPQGNFRRLSATELTAMRALAGL